MVGSPRRRFLYASVGAIAVAGLGYLTKDYYDSSLKEFYEKTSQTFQRPSPTPTITHTYETLTSPEQTPSFSATETPTPEDTIAPAEQSEDETMIKELMVSWRNLYSTGNVSSTGNVYTLDATVNFGCSKTGVSKLVGSNMIASFIRGLYVAQRGKMDNQRIIELRIEGNEAYVVSYEDLKMNRGNVKMLSRFRLKRISEIKHGHSTMKLPKPIWKIRDEYTHCAADG
ncbi:hypothetical protein KEJ39_03615 [Candidatus Bathyarchaeota archaeon]|nr:hypothetical protein [Candidatus Bathyarchaeota archaeon]